MKQYKGYYIDDIVFSSEQDIDEHILAGQLKDFEYAVKVFNREANFETASFLDERQEKLVNCQGYTWEEVEQITIEMFRILDLRNRA